jgi:hypothetical protein
MSRVDLHPEELLDRVRSGIATEEERLRVDAHLASCAACSIEQTLYMQTERSTAARPGDDVALARFRAVVQRAVAERAEPRGRAQKRWTAKRWALFAFAATLLLTTFGAATVLLREYRRAPPSPLDNFNARAPAAPIAARPAMKPAASSNLDDVAEPPIETRGPSDETRPPPSTPRSTSKVERPKTPAPTAADLFARANQLRRQDQAGEAAAAYRELQRLFPGTTEEVASRVVLGRLLLDRLGDAQSALSQFDSYLAHPAPGSLREEALVGRALALGRLGRSMEERLAWSALLESYPRSTYSPRARARLGTPATP